MLTFLFWNLNKRPLHHMLGRACRQREVDVLVLAECGVAPGARLQALNSHAEGFRFTETHCPSVAIYTRFASAFTKELHFDRRMTARKISLPTCQDFLLVGLHLSSLLHRSPASLNSACHEVAGRIQDVEAKVGHRRTVVVGDFNLGPFEDGMVSACAFHGVMTKAVAAGGQRIVDETPRPFLYNPMWSRFGDGTCGPPGTYFRRDSQAVTHFWHMLDQVLIRPDLLDSFDTDSLEILEEVDGVPLLRGGVPDRTAASDHLPVLFNLDLEGR